MAKYIAVLFVMAMLVGGIFSSCGPSAVDPGDTTKPKCDTCKDTTTHPCDTCNIDKDSAAHAFTWTEYTIPDESNLSGATVFADGLVMAVGRTIYLLDGSEWKKKSIYITAKQVYADATDMYTFAFSLDDVWITRGSIIYRCSYIKALDKFSAEEYRFSTDPPGFRACWGSSGNDMFFVGDKGNILHFDGEKFEKMNSPTTKALRDVWGTSHNDVWASGFNSSNAETVLLHYDGNSWTEDPISVSKGIYASGGFNAVFPCDSAGHKFIATSGAVLIRKTDNGAWRSDSGMISNSLGGGNFIGIAPRGNNANDFFVAGGWGFVAHWNGKTWKQYKELYDYSIPTFGASGFSVKGNTACLVGGKNGSWIAIGRRK